jgi:polysaccharide deacetylase family protein (PEP-CTERM system associated)
VVEEGPMSAVRNAFSVDVEDYFQVLAFESVIKRENWPTYELRVRRNVDVILELMEQRQVQGTFFILAWIAERAPHMVRQIAAAGHEIASHGCLHERVSTLTPARFAADIRSSKALLEDLGGKAVIGYRAPSYSIDGSTQWAFPALAEAGYRYSSSIFPGRHDLYGMPEAPRFPYHPLGEGLLEIPITTVEVVGRRMSCGGGGFFRLWPYRVFRAAIQHVNAVDAQPAVFYMHPWEVDPGQPRIQAAPLRSRFRHYLNLDRVVPRLRRLLGDFSWGRMDDVFGLRR